MPVEILLTNCSRATVFKGAEETVFSIEKEFRSGIKTMPVNHFFVEETTLVCSFI